MLYVAIAIYHDTVWCNALRLDTEGLPVPIRKDFGTEVDDHIGMKWP